MNPIIDTDSYKASHYLQFPPKASGMFSYLESRGGRFDRTVFFGLQYILKEYFSKPITNEMIDEAKVFFGKHGEPFNEDGWRYVANDLKGILPMTIRAVPEGSVVPTHNVLMSCQSTDPKAYWVVSYFETQLMRLWYGITVSTQSYFIKKLIYSYLQETADNPDAEIGFKLHDFGSRGVSSQESAMIGGAAHLVNFMGSDTCAGVYMANKYYGSDMAGFSIPAAEHSTITSWGKDHEVESFRNMLKQFAKPGALVAVVSDSYNIYDACEHLWGEQLKDEVIKSGATVVIRPDSGEPYKVVTKCLQILDAKFGSTVNAKGFKVLNTVRLIQGDGINEDSIRKILVEAKKAGYSTTNIGFGMGGALLQKVNRDTQKFAYKCSSVMVDGKWVSVSKDPVTDPMKKSKGGRLELFQNPDGTFATTDIDAASVDGLLVGPSTVPAVPVMRTVWADGNLLQDSTLDEIRARVNKD